MFVPRLSGCPVHQQAVPTDQLQQAAAARGSCPHQPIEVFSATDDSPYNALNAVREYAGKPIPPAHPEPLQPLGTTPPDAAGWPTADRTAAILALAATNVEDDSLSGARAEAVDSRTRKEIATFLDRQCSAEKGTEYTRLVHRPQLFGGQVEVHWNPTMNKMFKLFGTDTMQGLVRFSDASANANPNGESMFGMALELIGKDGMATDILLTGGTDRTEHSQAKNVRAQLDLFNMLNPPSKVGGLAKIVWDEGAVDGPRMLIDVKKMRTNLDSVADLTAWSRSPFELQGQDGKTYLVKMRAVPAQPGTPPVAGRPSATSTERLQNEFQARTQRGETRWRLEFQFMEPHDDAYDPREQWGGPWLAAAEIVVPKHDAKTAHEMSERAENTKFSVWKNKEPYSEAADRHVLRPWGELNRARLAAYNTSGSSRGCPYMNK